MPRDYRHPYNRKQRPNDTARPPLPGWLACTLQEHVAAGKNKASFQYWTKMYWATPAWLTDTHVAQMKAIYRAAGPTDHIDHEVPLCSPIVCGLNVPWNLRVIDANQNLLKSNAYWPDMPFQPQDMFDDHRYEDFLLQPQQGVKHGRAA